MKSLITAEEARHLCDKNLQKYMSIVASIKAAASIQRTSIFVKNKNLSEEVHRRLSLDGFHVVSEEATKGFSWVSWSER